MNKFTTFRFLLPGIGLVVYVIVFTLAAAEYPGGSENIPTARGYSFFHNFLCDVMNDVTHGGMINSARNMAILSHLIMSASMIGFFYILPLIFSWSNSNTRIIRYAGMFTMTVFVFMYTDYHDTIVTLTGLLGTVALVPFFIELRKHPGSPLKSLAYLCFFMSVVVFIIFETRVGFYYLPFLQKITFFLDAAWVIWVSALVYRKQKAVLSFAH